jgi:hypothetical protein
MSIVERSKIRSAYERAMQLGSTHEEACKVVADALCIDPEIVAEVVQQETES